MEDFIEVIHKIEEALHPRLKKRGVYGERDYIDSILSIFLSAQEDVEKLGYTDCDFRFSSNKSFLTFKFTNLENRQYYTVTIKLEEKIPSEYDIKLKDRHGNTKNQHKALYLYELCYFAFHHPWWFDKKIDKNDYEWTLELIEAEEW